MLIIEEASLLGFHHSSVFSLHFKFKHTGTFLSHRLISRQRTDRQADRQADIWKLKQIISLTILV